MIWFDSGAITVLTPNYQIQKFFSVNTGTKVLSPEKSPANGMLFQASSIDTDNGNIFTKLVNPYGQGRTVVINLKNTYASHADIVMLSGQQSAREVHIEECVIPVNGNSIIVTLAPFSAAILRIIP